MTPEQSTLNRDVVSVMQRTTASPFPSTDNILVTDAGLETWLVFQKGLELPAFAAYPLAATDEGTALLTEYYRHYASIAREHGTGVVLEAPTWRANPDWAATLGHDADDLERFIVAAVAVVEGVRKEFPDLDPFLVGGAVGPRGDGYRIDVAMTAEEAADYHSVQIGHLAKTSTDVVTAMTIGYADEAIGIAHAAMTVGLPVVVSFTVETDGRLPSGMSLGDAIERVDGATQSYPSHYMVNCAHPVHFEEVIRRGGSWVGRLGGLRANASQLSHAELDEMTELDDGDPADLAARYRDLRSWLPALTVVGGCCGTDHRHVGAITAAWKD